MFPNREDPFGMLFSHMNSQMRDMDRMMNDMMDPFGMMGMRPARANNMIDMGNEPVSRSRAPAMMQMGHPGFMDPFGGFGFGGIFNAMNQIQERASNDPNCHVYSHSTVMTMGEDGRPRVVENSMRKAGPVKETKRFLDGERFRHLRDGEREEMEIGHSIGDRTHVMEKKRDKDGNVRSQQRFVNLDQDNARDFDQEFQRLARGGGGRSYGARHHEAIGGRGYNARELGGSSGTSAPIVTLPDDDEDRSYRAESRGQTSRGPVIREISDEEAESSIPKRRRGPGAFRSSRE